MGCYNAKHLWVVIVRTLPVAPLWCDLGFVPDSRGNKAAANLRLSEMVQTSLAEKELIQQTKTLQSLTPKCGLNTTATSDNQTTYNSNIIIYNDDEQ